MDALALLCNLHADGPFTLQRLRRSGCHSLHALLELPSAELSAHLDGSARSAERFLREAQLLAERLEDQVSSEAEALPAPRHAFQEAGATPGPFLEDEDAEEELADDAGYEAELPEPDEELDDEYEELNGLDEEEEEPDDVDLAAEKEMQNVLATWRDADRDTPPEDPDDYVVPRPEPSTPANRALEELALEGLDPELTQRLGEIGILSLKGLIEASPLELSRNLPLAFTRVKHLQFLARRAWNRRPEPVQPPRSYDELVAVERLDASGPFAGEPGRSTD